MCITVTLSVSLSVRETMRDSVLCVSFDCGAFSLLLVQTSVSTQNRENDNMTLFVCWLNDLWFVGRVASCSL